MNSKPRLQVHVTDKTRIAVRNADGLPLVLAVRTEGIDIELIFPWDPISAVTPASTLAERASALFTTARTRASAAKTAQGVTDAA